MDPLEVLVCLRHLVLRSKFLCPVGKCAKTPDLHNRLVLTLMISILIRILQPVDEVVKAGCLHVQSFEEGSFDVVVVEDVLDQLLATLRLDLEVEGGTDYRVISYLGEDVLGRL